MFADAAVRECEFAPQAGDLIPQPLVLLERQAEPDADRFVPCAPAHRKPCWRPPLAALPLDVGAQVRLDVEELAADARPHGHDRERDRFACPLDLGQRAPGALRGARRARGCRLAQDDGALEGHEPSSPLRCWRAAAGATTFSVGAESRPVARTPDW
jgi:hypothetical protein